MSELTRCEDGYDEEDVAHMRKVCYLTMLLIHRFCVSETEGCVGCELLQAPSCAGINSEAKHGQQELQEFEELGA